MRKDDPVRAQLSLDVLQQFRIIYGSMRQHFRDVESRCGIPGSQMWVLQEVQQEQRSEIGELSLGPFFTLALNGFERIHQIIYGVPPYISWPDPAAARANSSKSLGGGASAFMLLPSISEGNEIRRQ